MKNPLIFFSEKKVSSVQDILPVVELSHKLQKCETVVVSMLLT